MFKLIVNTNRYPNGFDAVVSVEVKEVSDFEFNLPEWAERLREKYARRAEANLNTLDGYYFTSRELAALAGEYRLARNTYSAGFVHSIFIPRSNRAEKRLEFLHAAFLAAGGRDTDV